MLTAQRRHQPPCKRSMWDKGYTKCACPIMIRGTLNRKFLTLSTWKFLPPDKARDLEAARNLALLWERVGSPVRPEEYAPIAEPGVCVRNSAWIPLSMGTAAVERAAAGIRRASRSAESTSP
jgi:hypothetical protein